MKPIRPGRVLGGSIVVEGNPCGVGFADVYRGLDLGVVVDDIERDAPPRAAPEGPYRAAPPVGAPAPVPVIVRELRESRDEPWMQSLFEQATLARRRMTGGPAPRLLHTLGRGGRVLASVEEYLVGTRLDEVLGALRARGEQMPVPVALAIADGLLPLWITAAGASPPIRVLVDPATVILDGAGAVRVLPEYAEEHARQTVGAAVLLLRAPVSYVAPEQVRGGVPDARGAMFTLGVLLYEMIAATHPYTSSDTTMFEILSRIAHHDAPPLAGRRGGVEAGVTELVHRCLARDPMGRFDSWRELGRALAAVRALFPVVGPSEILECVRRLVPSHGAAGTAIALEQDAWRALPRSGYHAVPLPAAAPEGAGTRAAAREMPALDPDAVYAGRDARPMYAVSAALLVDARPVTRAELERFFIATRTARPALLDARSAATEDDACALVSAELAEAYARWAGKRIPTEAEWDAAVRALGSERLGTGQVWEWTSTPHASGGFVVCGGRWRDRATAAARPENRSFETSPAADVGFRCVASRSHGGAVVTRS